MRRRALACVIASAVCYSVSNVAADKSLAAGATVTSVTAVRIVVAAAAVWLLLLGIQTVGAAGDRIRLAALSWRRRAPLMCVGVLQVAQIVLLYQAVERIGSSLAVLLMYTYPALVAIVSVLVFAEPATAATTAAVGAVVLGVALVAGGPGSGVTVVGVACGLGAAASLAAYVLAVARATRTVASLDAAAWIHLGALVAFLPAMGWWAGSASALRGLAWAMVVGVASGTAAVLFVVGVRRLAPTVAAVTGTIEPVATATLGVALLGTTFAAAQFVGAALVVGGILLVAVTVSRRQPEKPCCTESQDNIAFVGARIKET